MNESSIAQKQKTDAKKAQTYLFKYVKDLKLHFSLTDEQILNMLNITLLDYKKKNTPKKWWHIWS